jgi:hypothetical protein
MSSSPLREHGASTSPASLSLAISLASPSLAAVCKYYQDHDLRTACQTELSPTEHTVHFSHSLPRRHSILSPGSLATHMEMIAISLPANGPGGEHVPEHRSIAEVSRDMLLDGVNHSELAKLGEVVSGRPLPLRPGALPAISGKVSCDHTHERLRACGAAYLGNAAVADVYVKAVQLRKLG